MEKKILEGFPSRLRGLRGELTLREFSRKIDLSLNTYQHYESGARKPNVALLLAISKACGVSVDWLLGVSEVVEPPCVSIAEDEWKRRALLAEQEIREYDKYIDLVVRGHEEMLKGVHGIVTIRKKRESSPEKVGGRK